jgi:hypothetical protein
MVLLSASGSSARAEADEAEGSRAEHAAPGAEHACALRLDPSQAPGEIRQRWSPVH